MEYELSRTFCLNGTPANTISLSYVMHGHIYADNILCCKSVFEY